MRKAMDGFWEWYERHYILNIAIATGLFLLQLLHLAWLSGDVLAERVTGGAAFDLSGALQWLIVAVDYTEMPTLVSVSLVYLNELRKKVRFRSVLYLIFLNSQWLHIFWITDEFVVGELESDGEASTLPPWLAYVAILIDYLELPVIADTIRKLVGAICGRRVS